MNTWLIIVISGFLTFGMRLSFIYFFGRVEIPAAIRRSLRFVPPAVLSALILPELLLPGGHLDFGPGNHRWLAGLIAVLVAWRTRNTLLTILAGIVALFMLQLVF